MNGRVKARPKTQLPVRVFVDSNGRSYPTSSPKSSSLGVDTCKTCQNSTQHVDHVSFTTNCSHEANHKNCSLDLLHASPAPTTSQHTNEHSLNSRLSGIHSNIMNPESPREHLSPLVESSKMAEQRVECGRRSAVAVPSSSKVPVDASPARSTKRADSKISNTSESSSPQPSKDKCISPAEVTSVIGDAASMHSVQSFDLGYKGRPARPYVNKSHTRVWNSMYTRPLEEMLREILEVRYPLATEGEDERSPLLGLDLPRSNYGWLCGLRRSWRTSMRREGEA